MRPIIRWRAGLSFTLSATSPRLADAWAIIRSMIAPASGLERSSARVSEME